MSDYAAGKPWKMAKRHQIMEAAYQLFCERGIELVTMPEIAVASGVGRATLYRYFDTKLDLVVAIAIWKWTAYVEAQDATTSQKTYDHMTGAEYLRFYLDSFIDLYRNHGDILRFNYNFNSYLKHEASTVEQTQPYMGMVTDLGKRFHVLYERGVQDGTLNTDVSEEAMFSSTFHIMLAAVTRYAVGLVYISDKVDPESELVMLEELLLSHYAQGA